MNASLFTIRRAKADDLPALQQLGTELIRADRRFDSFFEEHWHETDEGRKYLLSSVRGRNHTCLVAEIHGKAVGYAIGGILPHESWRPIKGSELRNLVVAQQYRRRGIGDALIAAFKEWSYRKGAVRIRLNVLAANKEGIAFYKKKGFNLWRLTLEADI
jgi:ribosomal protein S18 acetylase RimI-like enzyme